MSKKIILIFISATLYFTATGCTSEEKFEDLGQKLASPIDVATSDKGDYFYVLNADFDRTYNAGSVLVMDEDGTKITAVPTPRLGRTMTVAGNFMLVGFARQDEDNAAQLHIYDVTAPATPKLIKRFEELICNPVNIAAVKDYKHFAVTCSSGSIFMGTFPDSVDAPETASIKKIRRFDVIRRALYIDPKRELLMGFTAKFDQQNNKDTIYTDDYTYKDDGSKTAVPNDIPDEMESRAALRNNKATRRPYQFFVYDIKNERDNAVATGCVVTDSEDCVFPARRLSDPVSLAEQRFIYYNVSNFDGTPDITLNPNQKYYRTNFHTALADPDDPNAFYLSHRGIANEKGSPYANDVIRVSIIGNLKATNNVAPITQDVLSFERVSGFKGNTNEFKFPGDIEIATISGQKILLVNNFRDLVNWKRADVYFSIEAQSLDSNLWHAETENNSSPQTSWYQIAANERGKAMSVSFYGNAAMLLEIIPGVSLTQELRIE